MKIIQSVVASAIALTTITTSVMGDDLQKSLSDGKMTADLRAFYFNGDRDNRTDREAFVVGGIVKYESASYYGFKVGGAFFGAYDLLDAGMQTAQKGSIENGAPVNLVTKNLAGNTEMVNSDGSAIETLGEAYLQYNVGQTMLKVGRQRLNTPLMNDYYNRFLPNSFEAVLLTNKDIPDTELMAIYSFGWKYKASDTFIGMTDGLEDPAIDEDVMMLGFKNSTIPNTKVGVYVYHMPNVIDTFYTQVDNSKLVEIDAFKLSFSLQYLNQQESGDALRGPLDSYLAGAKVNFALGNAKFTAMYDQVGDHTIEGSGTDYSAMGFSKFINFTDIQIDGEALNAGAVSYGAVFGYKFGDFKPAIKYVHIEQDLAMEAAGTTSNTRPSSDEWNLDFKYKIDDVSKLRVRLAEIDYESTHPNEFDEVNIRVIYDYKFSVSGS